VLNKIGDKPLRSRIEKVSESTAILITFLFVFFFSILPIIIIAVRSDIQSVYEAIFGKYSWIFYGALRFSFIQAAISATFSTLFGSVVAYSAIKTSKTLARYLRTLSIVAFMLPSTVVASSFYILYGIRGIPLGKGFWGIISAHVFYNAPLAYLYAYSTLSGLKRETIEALQIFGKSKRKVVFNIYFRLLLPALTSSWLLSFIYCFTSFAIPLTLGGPGYWTLEVYIYYLFRVLNNPSLGAFMALVQVGALSVVIYSVRKFKTSFPSGEATFRKNPVFLPVVLFYVLYEVLPILNLAYRSFFDPISHEFTLRALNIISSLNFKLALVNTLYFALLASIISLILGVISSKSLIALKIASLPISVSSVVLGLGLYILYSEIIPTWVLIPIAHSIVALPLVSSSLYVGRTKISKELGEYAMLHGIGGLKYYFEIFIPLVIEAFGTALMFSVVISLAEFGATYMLYQSEYETLSILVYRLTAKRMLLEASFVSFIVVLISTVLSIIIAKYTTREAQEIGA